MKDLLWKVSTFASLGAAAFFAIHPFSFGAKTERACASDVSHVQRLGGASPASWLGGLFAASKTAALASSKASPLSKLQSARTSRAQCEAASEIAEDADDDGAQALIDLASKRVARSCARSARSGR